MKQRIHRIITLTPLLITLTTISIQAEVINTQDKIVLTSDSLEQLNRNELISFTDMLLTIVINKDTTTFQQYDKYFTRDTYEKFMEYIKSNDVYGSPSKRAVDTIPVKYSNTNDYVIQANYEILTLNSNYTLTYLYELHVNSEGKIYGYNVWVY